MSDIWAGLGFGPADIMLPENCDMSKWSVVACDQYTSQPEYWERVKNYVGSAPSTLKLTLPEAWLDLPDKEERIDSIHTSMEQYINEGLFRTYPDSLFYVERRLSDGLVRHGLIGAIDLEEYDFSGQIKGLTRASEAVVTSRIPPRVAIRKDSQLELPHALMLIDDPQKTVIEPLTKETSRMELLYDFTLMEMGGNIRGYLLPEDLKVQVAQALRALADPVRFNARHNTSDEPPMLFAVGDGNHSLASAREIYLASKGTPDEPYARYSLVEIGNAYDDSLQFEAINRVMFDVKPAHLLRKLLEFYPGSHYGVGDGHSFSYCIGNDEGQITVPYEYASLAVGALQTFLDAYLNEFGGKIDYIHGDNVTRKLSRTANTVGFIVPAMDKEGLFSSVIFEGKLPRKAFSMGHANDKRYYLEARKIKARS